MATATITRRTMLVRNIMMLVCAVIKNGFFVTDSFAIIGRPREWDYIVQIRQWFAYFFSSL